MSLDLWFEANERLTLASMSEALRKSGASVKLIESSVEAHFPSGMTAYSLATDGQSRIKAEDPKGAKFKVSLRCIFSPVASQYDESMSELRSFLGEVAASCGAHFVVSFQLEETLFLHTGSGVQSWA